MVLEGTDWQTITHNGENDGNGAKVVQMSAKWCKIVQKCATSISQQQFLPQSTVKSGTQ